MASISWRSAVLLATLIPAPYAMGQLSFQGLGDLPGGSFESIANGVNDLGWVVGRSTSSFGLEAYRWTPGGLMALGDFSGGIFESHAFGISADGSVVAGYGRAGSGNRAFRWTSGGLVDLGELAGGADFSFATALSQDGAFVVGFSESGSGLQAFRWSQSGGMTGLGDLPGGIFASAAIGVSNDGNVVAGTSSATGGDKAFRWTASGMTSLGDLPGGTAVSHAEAMSGDGSVIVGHSVSSLGDEIFRWTTAEGMHGLGDLSGGTFTSNALGVSADGTIVVGEGTTASGPRAILWTTNLQSVTDLASYLTARGANLTGWTLVRAKCVSPNGRWVAGDGINPQGQPEAWVASIDNVIKGARYVSQTPPPGTMVAGTQANVSMTFRNIGNTTWTPDGKYYLGSRNPVDNLNWGLRRLPMAAGTSCPPNQDYTFTRAITAPWEPGTYIFQWKSLNATGWFGDLSPNVTVSVTRATNAGVFVSQSGIPTTIAPGGTFTASITMKNTGTASWTTATGFKLGSWNPTNNTTWGSNRWDMPAGSNIATNGQVTFTRTFTAPTTPGTYVFQWRMIKSGVAFFGTTSTAVSIKVQ